MQTLGALGLLVPDPPPCAAGLATCRADVGGLAIRRSTPTSILSVSGRPEAPPEHRPKRHDHPADTDANQVGSKIGESGIVANRGHLHHFPSDAHHQRQQRCQPEPADPTARAASRTIMNIELMCGILVSALAMAGQEMSQSKIGSR